MIIVLTVSPKRCVAIGINLLLSHGLKEYSSVNSDSNTTSV